MRRSNRIKAKQSDQAISPLFQPPAQQRKEGDSKHKREHGPKEEALTNHSKKRKVLSPQMGDEKRFKQDDQPLDSVEPLPPLLDHTANVLLPMQPVPILETEMLSAIVDLINGDLPHGSAEPTHALEEPDWATFCPLPPLPCGVFSDDVFDRPFAFFDDPSSAPYIEEAVTDEPAGSDPLLTLIEPTF